MDFYEILSGIMEREGLTIPEVARKCGLSDSTVRSIFDRKQKKIALNVAFKVADGLGVSLEELNGELNSNTNTDDAPKLKAVDPIDPQKDVLNRNYDNLNAEGRKKLVDYSDDLVSGGRYMLTAAHGGGVKKVPAPDPSKDKEIERLTREAMLNSLEDDEEF